MTPELHPASYGLVTGNVDLDPHASGPGDHKAAWPACADVGEARLNRTTWSPSATCAADLVAFRYERLARLRSAPSTIRSKRVPGSTMTGTFATASRPSFSG